MTKHETEWVIQDLQTVKHETAKQAVFCTKLVLTEKLHALYNAADWGTERNAFAAALAVVHLLDEDALIAKSCDIYDMSDFYRKMGDRPLPNGSTQ